jgi:transposase InsO family protein
MAIARATELAQRGIVFKHSRPYHPQTCGKVERFHQTMKKYLAANPTARSLAQLIDNRDVRVLTTDGQHIADHHIDPDRTYQPRR